MIDSITSDEIDNERGRKEKHLRNERKVLAFYFRSEYEFEHDFWSHVFLGKVSLAELWISFWILERSGPAVRSWISFWILERSGPAVRSITFIRLRSTLK